MPMTTSRSMVLSAIRALGTPEELLAKASSGLKPKTRPLGNSHVHLPPNFSAFETVEQVVQLAAEQSIGVLGVTNYYDYTVYGNYAALAQKTGLFPLFGLEVITLIDELVKSGVLINDPGNPGKMYLCGKGVVGFEPETMTPEAKRLLDTIRKNDSTRIAQVVTKLSDVFAQRGFDLGVTVHTVIDMVAKRHGCPRESVYLQERHVCMAFQQAFFANVPHSERPDALTKALGAASKNPEDPVVVQNEIRAHLMKAGKPAFVDETFISFEEGHRFILEMGGIPCYPTLADGTSPICGYEDPIDKLISTIRNENIYCAEFIPIRNTPEVLSTYVKAMRAAGIVVTGGTEHNTLDLLPIDPKCVKGAPVPEDVQEIFWEGSCVVAAHEFLKLHGECGFVTQDGTPNPAFSNDESRIAHFRNFGAAVIESYFQTYKK